MSMHLLQVAVLTCVGLILGSFAGCLSYRTAAGLSVVSPSRSFCPGCGAGLRWFENIPILSYLVQRGRCGHCGRPIGVRYVVIEAAMASCAFGLALGGNDLIHWVLGMATLFLLVVAAAVEVESGRVPGYVFMGIGGAAAVAVVVLPGVGIAVAGAGAGAAVWLMLALSGLNVPALAGGRGLLLAMAVSATCGMVGGTQYAALLAGGVPVVAIPVLDRAWGRGRPLPGAAVLCAGAVLALVLV
jgi:leader peptidase (prepilin peptidase)/N-methyltransferase